ncbi:MAG: FtsX-like permease family protein, partial [[Eubacterium] sulci]|nr:FtsX-like permease family protein [[Eubacterium] sulci]
MPRNFTLKLAVSNLKKNRKLYMPYIIASIIMIAVIYIMSFLSNSKDLANFRGANYVTLSMLLGNIIVSGFAIIFSFYINSFLMKQRSKEFGLYNILGMEKRHLGRVLVAESMISSSISIIMGLGVGILFSKLALMVITKMIGAGYIIAFEV